MKKQRALLLLFLGTLLTDIAFLDTFEKLQISRDLSMILAPLISFMIWISIYFGILSPKIKPDEKKPVLV